MAALTLKLQPHRQPALEELKPVTSTRYLKFLINNTQLFNLTEPACRMGLSVRFSPTPPTNWIIKLRINKRRALQIPAPPDANQHNSDALFRLVSLPAETS